MPNYEYRCQSCGKELEVFQRIVDPPLKDCPTCSKPMLERLISLTSFQLKGSGWYKDGYGSKGGERTEKQVTDRLSKAVDDDKKKTEAAAAPASESSGGSSGSTGSGSSGGGSGSGGSGIKAAAA